MLQNHLKHNDSDTETPHINLPSRTHPWGKQRTISLNLKLYIEVMHTSWPSNPHPLPGTIRTIHSLWIYPNNVQIIPDPTYGGCGYNWRNSSLFLSSSTNSSRDSGLQYPSFCIVGPHIRIFDRCFVCGGRVWRI